MAIAFQRAPSVQPGEEITYGQFWRLARAFNDRLRANLGDDTWRVFFYVFSIFRQIRNSDGVFSFPTMAEFFEFYQNLDPELAQWPPSAAGEPEGVNVANPLGAFVFGNGALESEAERYKYIPTGDPQTLAEGWDLAKQQRGGFDPVTGALSAPVFSAARSHLALNYKLNSPHGTSYGGFIPGPAKQGDCSDGTSETDPTPNLELFFTNLDTGAVQTFPGTCPDVPEHVRWVSYVPSIGYYVLLNSGDEVFFPDKAWIYGPFSGTASLSKQQSDFLPRVLNKFASEFRGSDAQRQGKYNLDHAFDFQRFHETYYRLAPQYGRQAGDFVYEEYPLFILPSSGSAPWYVAKGTYGKYQGSTRYRYHEGFICPGFKVVATGLQTVATLAVMDGETVVHELTVSPGDDVAVWLEDAHTFHELRVVLQTSAQFASATGQIAVEFLETLAYRPAAQDLFLLLRLGSAYDGRLIDGRGIDEEHAQEIGETYFAYGCMAVGFLPLAVDEINGNGVYDAARRFSRMVRCIPRQNLVGYAVENGKSVCWFKRYARGMDKGVPIDLFWDIAPSRLEVASGAIVPGRKYVVKTGFVMYAGGDYPAGKTFTGVYGAEDFKGGTVMEYEGIRHEAGPGDVTNQWLMGCQFKVGSKFESNPFKYESYSDYFALSDRCTFYSEYSAVQKGDLTRHFSYGQKVWNAPENPSGYRYLHGINNSTYASPEEKLQFWRSCRIHEPDPEIDSATVAMENGVEIVKLVFTGRFHHCPDAPASIPRDYAAWTDDPNAEPHRTMENGLRCHILLAFTGKRVTPMIGDTGLRSGLWGLYSTLDGAALPHFLFTQLIPEPHIQTEDSLYEHGTPAMHDPFAHMGVVLRAICEGYVDGKTTEDFGCACFEDSNKVCSLFNYTWQNLCHDAFGDKWLHSIPLENDNKEGFWPLPNTFMMASIFNEFSAAINKLTRANVWLPHKFESKTDTYELWTPVTATNSDGSNSTCTTNAASNAFWVGQPPNPTAKTSEGTWIESTGNEAILSAKINEGNCSGNQWYLVTTKQITQWRWQPASSDALEAIPEGWRDMVLSNVGTLVKITTETSVTKHDMTSDPNAGTGCCFSYQEPCPGFYSAGGGLYHVFTGEIVEQKVCVMATAGTLIPEPLGRHVLTAGRSASGAQCFSGAHNRISVQPLATEAAYLEVPLVD